MVTTPADALALVTKVCLLPGNGRYLEEVEEGLERAGLADAVARHETPRIYRWLMDGFSYQGIADSIATGFIARHGNAQWAVVAEALAGGGSDCPKLSDFSTYRNCSYRKGQWDCSNPQALPACPVPTLPLRKGILNEQAFSLFLFIRDRCDGDLVAFIDKALAAVPRGPQQITRQREALLAAFSEITGVSRKLASMTLADLLIGARSVRPGWVGVGRSMVVIDSLVHNFLHRTGILAAYASTHAYGPRCFGEDGCEAILRDLATRFDARTVNRTYPRRFPRFVQHAIWRFCGANALDICNGRNIDDAHGCELGWCPLWGGCSRLPLRAAARQSRTPQSQ